MEGGKKGHDGHQVLDCPCARVRDDEGNAEIAFGDATIKRKSHLTGSSPAPARIIQL